MALVNPIAGAALGGLGAVGSLLGARAAQKQVRRIAASLVYLSQRLDAVRDSLDTKLERDDVIELVHETAKDVIATAYADRRKRLADVVVNGLLDDGDATTLRRFEKAAAALDETAIQLLTRSAAGRLVLNILVSVSQWEREAIGERTRDALRHKRATGRVYGHAPFGFDAVGDRLVEVEAALRTIAEMRRLATAGSSLRTICAVLAASGLATKRGGSWRPSTVHAILRRPWTGVPRSQPASRPVDLVDEDPRRRG